MAHKIAGHATLDTIHTMQLTIDECEEWIWDSLQCIKGCDFQYMKIGNKEFLICNTNDFFVDTRALDKIKKTTGMVLVQMGAHDRYLQLWFGRKILFENTQLHHR